MQPVRIIKGTAAPIFEENVDTDIIFPARFLLITAREGLGRYAFHDRRFNAKDSECGDFILNRPAWREARILIADANFGCGSSREQAVWALSGFGIGCIIASSFGEIFEANCYRNSLVPLTLSRDMILRLTQAAETGVEFTVDLEALTLSFDETTIAISLPDHRRQALLNGWDDTATILNTYGKEITAFEERHAAAQSWLFDEELA